MPPLNIRLATQAMGTRFELVLHGEDEFFLRSAGERAIEIIEEEHDRLSLFDPTSLVGRINCAPPGRAVPVDRALLDLLALGARVREESGGAFDPAVGAHMRAWGHRGPPDRARAGAPGSDALAIDTDAATVTRDHPDVALDLGGVAKGHALDLAAGALRDAGVGVALLHGGTSSIAALGAPPGSPGWRVRLGESGEEVVLRDACASLSSPAGRVSDSGDSHVIDPRSGRPVQHPTESVIVGASGALADAWATALVVLGRRPGTMPPEIGSAVRTPTGWEISPAMEPVFVAPPGTNRLEHE